MAAAEVRLTGRLICRSLQEVEIVRRHLLEHVRLTRQGPGCLSFVVEQTENPLVWRVEERFVDRQAFAHHQNRTRASEWWSETSGIARDYEISGLE